MSLLHMLISGAAKKVAPPPNPLGVNVTPSSINQAETLCPITSPLLTATGSGGASPYSYAWDWLTGGTGLTINSPSSNTTTLTQSGSGIKTGTLRCTVTDDDTDTAVDTASVTMECGT